MAKKPTGPKPTPTPRTPATKDAESKTASATEPSPPAPSVAEASAPEGRPAGPTPVSPSGSTTAPIIKKTAARKTSATPEPTERTGAATKLGLAGNPSGSEPTHTAKLVPDARATPAAAVTGAPLDPAQIEKAKAGAGGTAPTMPAPVEPSLEIADAVAAPAVTAPAPSAPPPVEPWLQEHAAVAFVPEPVGQNPCPSLHGKPRQPGSPRLRHRRPRVQVSSSSTSPRRWRAWPRSAVWPTWSSV